MCHQILKKEEIGNEKKITHILFLTYTVYSTLVDYFSDSTDNNSTSSSTLHVPGSSIRSNSPNSTIATLISVPSAPQLTADTHHLNNSIKSETGELN